MVSSKDGWAAFISGFVAGMFMGAIMFGLIFFGVGFEIGSNKGAIAAHKGEIVCVQLAFKEERWECGET